MDLFGIDHAAVLLAEGDSLRVRAHEGRLTPNLDMGSILSLGQGWRRAPCSPAEA